jgi:trigger factor
MTTFVREDVDALNVVLTCTVPAADYAGKVKSQLAKIQKSASIKGFRPGKVPQAMIDKMYEKGAIHDVVVKQLDEDLNNYLNNPDFKYLGQPLPLSDNFNPVSVKAGVDFEFKYEMGLFPDFTIKGADSSYNVTRYEVEVTDEMLETEILELRKRYGQRGEVDTVTAESILTVRLTELNADGTAKEGGIAKEDGKFLMTSLSESARAAFLGKSIADTVRLNIYEVETGITEERVKTWILGADAAAEINADFDAVVLEVKDMLPATMDESFFEKVFGEDADAIKDEAGLRQFFKDMIQSEFGRTSTQMVLNNIHKNLLEVNDFAIPEAFMRKWLKFNDPKMTDEKLDTDWANICKDIRWSIMKSHLVQEGGLKTNEQEVYDTFYQEVSGYFGQYGNPEMIISTAERLMKNEEAFDRKVQEIMSSKVLLYVANKVDTTTEMVSKTRFDEILAAHNAEGAAILAEAENAEMVA